MSSKEKIKAQLVIVVGLLSVAILFKIQILIKISAALGLVFLLIPKAGDAIVKLWFKLAEVLGWVNSRILLSIIYFFILFPVALLQKVFSRNDKLFLRNKKLNSTFIERNKTFVPKDLKHGW